MYKSSFDNRKAALFDNNEVFIVVASIDEQSKTIKWLVPKIIIDDFGDFISSIDIEDPHEPVTKEIIADWFCQKLNICPGGVDVFSSIEYVSTKNKISSGVALFNQKDILPISDKNKITEIYHNKSMKVCVCIQDNKIVSIADDNGNGVVSIETMSAYKNKGYATECLKRLIFEYNKSGEELSFPTKIDNKSAIKVAEKCKMKKLSTGYWVRVDKDKGLYLWEKYKKLFEE